MMTIKNIRKTITVLGYCLLISGLAGCTDYLDKEADSTVSSDTAFKNFVNFQGFVEEIYNCIPDKEKCNYCVSFNWGDDEILNSGMGDSHFTHDIDNGNYRAWSTNNQLWLYRSTSDPTSDNKFNHSLWGHAWYCIRKANIGLAHLDDMKVATKEEKDLIAGQLYFFRAWWHEELMQWFGGLPYIDHAIESTGEEMKFPRLSYQECADKCAADFRKAADLLPIDWENTVVGSQRSGRNDLYVNKIAALGYLGKVLLWASSPLMENGAQTGALTNGKTYIYNKEYAKRAAEAFGELLNLVETGQTKIQLAEFSYSNVYNHIKSSSATTCFSDLFYTNGQGWKMPGSCEAIFRGPSSDYNGSNWNFTKTWGTKIGSLVEHDNVIHQPTANYINYAYGMEDGSPIMLADGTPNPASGFDVTHPFKNRDPRFYHDIVFDGFKYVLTTIPDGDELKPQQYCNLFSGGITRDVANASRTGYYTQKLVPHQANKYDGMYNWSGNLHTYLPYMRLGDVYTMYAEACAVNGVTYTPSTFTKTAEDAINTLRDRVGAGHVNVTFAGTVKGLIDEVRRERAVELAFEGFRFNDLQRWLLLSEAPYAKKTSQEFQRMENEEYFKNNDPRNAQVQNWHEASILQRHFEPKHYWLPLPDKDVYLYPEFEQNPGW